MVLAETDDLDQEGFPDKIKERRYRSERDLVEDLEEAGLIDDYKYIALTPGGRAYRTEMPSIYHETAVEFLANEILKQRGGSGPLLCKNNFEMNFADGTSKFPDLAIFGEARRVCVDDDDDLSFYEPKTVYNEQLRDEMEVNPDVILEFSLTNKLPQEIAKIEKQMNEHFEAQGKIKVGFLIKSIPARGKNDYPSKKNQASRDNPLCGFDVYELRGNGDRIVQPTSQYRVSGNEETCLTITDADLGRSPDASGVYHIPLSSLRHKLEQSRKCAVKFEQKRGE